MAEVIRMPLLSDTMKEGVIANWNKQVGDSVRSDDAIADVETDKATMEVIPYVEGTLLYIGVEKGKAAKVNDIIAIIGKPGEDISALIEAPQNLTTSPAAEPKAQAEASPEVSEAPVSIPKDLTVIRMPLLSDTMKEGKIVTWNKNVGDLVKADDSLADVETDKATMEVVGYAEGTLLYQGIPAGQAAKVNEVIAVVGPAGTDLTPYLNAFKSAPEGVKPAPVENAKMPEAPIPAATIQTTQDDGRIKASPLAKQIARDKGIDLRKVREW
jgi:pyruvate dehydrogenase E2 component (dihydrolipoamide acetyltransferase)